MIWLVPIVVLFMTIYFAQRAVHAQTNRSSTVTKSLSRSQNNSKTSAEHSVQSTTPSDTQNTSNLTAPASESAAAESTLSPVRKNASHVRGQSQTQAQPVAPSHLTKNNVKPHEAPSLLFANNAAESSKGDKKEDDYDEVADLGDITMDISEMLKELNLRDTDSPRLEIDADEYSQLKTGQPGDVQPDKIVNVAGKLRKMLN